MHIHTHKHTHTHVCWRLALLRRDYSKNQLALHLLLAHHSKMPGVCIHTYIKFFSYRKKEFQVKIVTKIFKKFIRSFHAILKTFIWFILLMSDFFLHSYFYPPSYRGCSRSNINSVERSRHFSLILIFFFVENALLIFLFKYFLSLHVLFKIIIMRKYSVCSSNNWFIMMMM